MSLAQVVREEARELGFCAVGVTHVEPFEQAASTAREHLRQGFMDGLGWFTLERMLRGSRPLELLPSGRSIISVAMSYAVPQQEGTKGLAGRVSRYARGLDYHPLVRGRLRLLVSRLAAHLGRTIQSRVFADDGPMLERAVAQRAGVGWFGKNTCIIVPGHGSWVFLGEAIVDVELEPDPPLAKKCGRCTGCMEACPTGALVAPYVLDSRRCLSYLTIENRGPILRHLRPLLGDRLFGCDTCQEMCPVNRKATLASHPWWQGPSALGLKELLQMGPGEFRQRFQLSPIKRAHLAGLQRNACVVLGNLGDDAAVPALAQVLENGEALVRGHTAWALGRLGGKAARQSLERALDRERDEMVVEEIRLALEGKE